MDASATTCSHVYCQNGLFYDAEPLRTHAQCQHCRKDSETDATLALKRCTGCFIDAYCSEECQQAAWKDHKDACKYHSSQLRAQAEKISQNPAAWPELTEWVAIHHDAFMNATLARYLKVCEEQPDTPFARVAAKNFLFLTVPYKKDSSLPAEDRFMLFAARLSRKNDPFTYFFDEYVSAGRKAAIEKGKLEYGDAYAGTGSFLVWAMYGPGQGVPFVRHFSVDEARARAKPACRDPLDYVNEHIAHGELHYERWK
ncbi:hypothetical protein K466DRAFT_665407 [Polyporus arcularius HHB13444]|uniref:MYND-type domain-containing protein n=1 Tax=Polyporus arcularius HHB13444 TaxID=1314778 RepID=A0A5C3P3J2_9APHY|nr:hypothetical protein K466DRAFT_665407 [Polyporus arcularius HHB13444]